MAVNRVPVLKRCRSLGLDPIYLGIDKKSNRNSNRSNRKMSEYGLQLREKQKAKFIYGVLEKPFRNYYKKAQKKPGQTGENLMIITGGRTVPAWVEVDQDNLKGEIKELPKREEIDVPVDEMLIVELYSK